MTAAALGSCTKDVSARPQLIAVLSLVGALMSGCSSGHRSILEQGVGPNLAGRVHRISAAEALRDVRRSEAWWRHQIKSRAGASPQQHFANLPGDELRLRLARLAARYDFRVVSLELWQPLPHQLAPKVVVTTKHYLALARATPVILKQLDPKRPTGDDRTGWRYEGFFFRAEDEHTVPFLAVFNFWRGTRSRGGGQWARSEPLFPFAHG
jgi:hypothetical protein